MSRHRGSGEVLDQVEFQELVNTDLFPTEEELLRMAGLCGESSRLSSSKMMRDAL